MDGDLSLAELGEFPMIDRIVAGRSQPAGVLLGPGDDAAVVSTADARVAVSTDMLVEGRHFRLDWSSPHDLGRKAIAQNAADIEAMGASVTSFVVAFGAPAQTPASRVQELADGMWFEAGSLGAGIVGGDLVCSPQWVVSVTALGDLAGRPPVLRSGARAGMHVAVIGDLGHSAAGLALWQNGINGFEQLRRRHLVPEPPYGQGAAAAETGALAMTDVSDGLLADLGHIATASGVVINLKLNALQSDIDVVAAAAHTCRADPRAFVLGGGEDHALVACFDGTVPEGWRVIGHVGEGSPAVLVDGSPWTGSTGWESFD